MNKEKEKYCLYRPYSDNVRYYSEECLQKNQMRKFVRKSHVNSNL